MVALLLIDPSAAFDTLDHYILLQHFSFSFSIKGQALKWMESFLTNMHQHTTVGSSSTRDFVLQFGVPHGAVLGNIVQYPG